MEKHNLEGKSKKGTVGSHSSSPKPLEENLNGSKPRKNDRSRGGLIDLDEEEETRDMIREMIKEKARAQRKETDVLDREKLSKLFSEVLKKKAKEGEKVTVPARTTLERFFGANQTKDERRSRDYNNTFYAWCAGFDDFAHARESREFKIYRYLKQLNSAEITFNDVIQRILQSPFTSAGLIRFRGMRAFDPEDCHIWFGRKRDQFGIRKMVKENALVILHGASGIGKTSIVNAGLGAFYEDIMPIRLLNARDQAVFQRCLEELSTLTTEEPALAIIDQVEAVWDTNLDEEDGKAGRAFAMIKDFLLKNTRNRAIVICREEFLSKVKIAIDMCDMSVLVADYPLRALERDGIVAAIVGPLLLPHAHHGRMMPFSEELVDHLTACVLDKIPKHRSIVLQHLLLLLWNRSKESKEQELQKDSLDSLLPSGTGSPLRYFIEQIIEDLRQSAPQWVENGVALGYLKEFVAAGGRTTHVRSRTWLDEFYGRNSDGGYRELEGMFLKKGLIIHDEAAGGWMLAHDALASEVHEMYQESQEAGPAAQKLLERRMSLKHDIPLLTEDELNVVNTGKPWMRAWTELEAALVDESQSQLYATRAAARSRSRTRAGLISLLLGAGMLAIILYLHNTNQKAALAHGHYARGIELQEKNFREACAEYQHLVGYGRYHDSLLHQLEMVVPHFLYLHPAKDLIELIPILAELPHADPRWLPIVEEVTYILFLAQDGEGVNRLIAKLHLNWPSLTGSAVPLDWVKNQLGAANLAALQAKYLPRFLPIPSNDLNSGKRKFWTTEFPISRRQFVAFANSRNVTEATIHTKKWMDEFGNLPPKIHASWDSLERGADEPITLTYNGARAYCDWIHAQLPTREEWMMALGDSSTIALQMQLRSAKNHSIRDAMANDHGLKGMVGRVLFWTCDPVYAEEKFPTTYFIIGMQENFPGVGPAPQHVSVTSNTGFRPVLHAPVSPFIQLP